MWDERYSAEHYIYGTTPNRFLSDKANVIPAGKVLCLADGEGRNSVFLAKQGYTVTAVDSSQVGLAKAQRLAEKNGVKIEFIHADLADFDLGENKWDGIVSIFCHLPSAIRKTVYPQVLASLKPNGVLLLEAYTEAQIGRGTGGPPTADLMLSAEILRQELHALNFSHLVELERDVTEGTHHSGIGAVVQAIGSKQ